MNATDRQLIDRLLAREGGGKYVHHDSDRGGPTKYGITKRTLKEWRGYDVTTADVQRLTEPEARDIYTAMYLAPWKAVRDDELRELLFDCSVLHGVGRTKRWLQEALDVEVDGVMGPETEAALERADYVAVCREVIRVRLRAVGRLITDRPDQAVFAAGWCNRIAEFV